MCKICEKIDSMIDCLDSLHSTNELRQVLITQALDRRTVTSILDMSDEAIRMDFAVELVIFLTEKYGLQPYDVIAEICKRYAAREISHQENELS